MSLKVGQREFIGEGQTRQSARHNAAEKAVKVLKCLPLPGEGAGKSDDNDDDEDDEDEEENGNDKADGKGAEGLSLACYF